MLTKQKLADCVKCIRTLDARAFIPRPRGVLAALVGIIFFSGSSYAATVVFQQWAQRYDGPSHDYDQPYAGVVVDSAGNSYVSGPSANRGLFWDWATVKYDANGTRLWVSTFGLTGSVDNWSNAVTLDPSGNAVVVGAIGGVNLNGDSRKPNSSFVGANFATVKYASNGNELWSRTYNANNNEDIANAVTTDASGNVYVTGQSVGSFVRPDFATIKYDSSGNLEWVARYHGTPEFSYIPTSIAVNGGFVYVTGQGGSIGTGADIVTIKYPAACSNPCSAVWVSTFNSSGNGQDVAAKIAVSAAGNIYVSGYIRFSDWVVVAYDPSGNQLWSAQRPAGGNVSRGMTLDAAGNVYVTGDSNPGGQIVATTAKFNGSTGAVMWANTYGGPPNGLGVQGSGNAIALDPSGNAYVTGGYVVSATNNNYDVATVKYDANRIQQWLKTYNGPGNGEDVGVGLGLDSAGNVFVAGNSVGVGTGSSDFASIRYTQGNGIPVAQERFANTNLNTPVSITMSASDVDGDPLVFSIVASPANGTLGPITNTSCASGSCTAQVNYTPASGFFGLDAFTFKATDGTIDSNIASSSIAVNSPNGSPVFPRWAQRYDGPSHDYDQPYAGVTVDSAGNSYVSGPSANRGLFWDWATVKYDATGSRLWVSTFGLTGSVDNWSNAVTLDPSGNAVVVGAIGGVNLNGDSRKPNSSFVGANFATVKYDPNGNALWSRTYNANNNEDIANAVTTDAGGNVYVTGQSVGSFVRQDFATIKYDSSGNLQWVARYHGTPEFSYIPTSIAVSGGFVYVTGQGGSLSTGADIVTIKYPVACSNPCSAVWVSTFNSSGNGQDVAAKIAVAATGNVYVSGYIRFSDWVVVAYDPSGNQLWSARRPAGGNVSRGMTLDAAGNVYVTGDSNPGGQVVATTAKFNGSTGALMWANTYGGPPNGLGIQGSGNAIALDSSGNAYVTGGYVVSATNNNYDVATVKYDVNGVQQWLQTYNGPGNGEDVGLGIGLNSTGNVFVTGNSVGVGTGSSDFVTLRYAQNNTPPTTSNQFTNTNVNAPLTVILQGSDLDGNALTFSVAASPTFGILGAVTSTFCSGNNCTAQVVYTPNSGYTGSDSFSFKVNDGVSDSNVAAVSVTINTTNGAPVFQQWAQRYNGPSNDYDQPYAGVAVDSAGNSYASGPSADRGLFWDWATVKYDANGTRVWVSTFGLTGSVDNWSNAVTLDSSGNAVVVGAIGGVNLNGDSRKPNSSFIGANFATVKYDPNGTALWSRTYNANNNEDIANAVTTDAAGNVYVTGQSVGSLVRPDFATIKYDSSGNLQWVARYHGTPEFSYIPTSIAVSGGFVYVTGQGGSIGTGADIVTIKYPATCSNPCSAVWVSTFNSSGNGQDVAAKIAVSAAGNIYVSGYIRFSDWVVVAYDPNGTQLWSARRPAGGNASRGMTLDAAGNVYVTGDSNPGGQVVATTAKFNGSTGAVMWVNTYGGPPNGLGVQGSGNAIALDSSGNAYVTGGYVVSATNNNYDVATVKYDANGVQQWLKTYNGPGNGEDIGLGLGLDSAGNVFVTGNSVGVGTGSSDFVTIKHALQPTFSATSADTEVGLTSYNPSLTITAVSTATPAVSLALASVTLQGLVLVSAVYDIDPSTPLSPPGTLTFRFDPAVVLDTSTLAIYRYNGVNWSSAAITGQIVFDMPNPRVVGNLAHTSLYALFVEQPDRLPPALALTPVNGSTTTLATPVEFQRLVEYLVV